MKFKLMASDPYFGEFRERQREVLVKKYGLVFPKNGHRE